MAAGEASFVLDNTAISNFSAVGRTDILRERYGGRLVVTREVLLEAERGPRPEAIRQAIEEGWAELRPIYADSDEYRVLVELRSRGFGLGEAASIAVCSTGGEWVFVSDDRDARREANRRGVGVVEECIQQPDGRLRYYGRPEGYAYYLRVIVTEDGTGLLNAFFDEGYTRQRRNEGGN